MSCQKGGVIPFCKKLLACFPLGGLWLGFALPSSAASVADLPGPSEPLAPPAESLWSPTTWSRERKTEMLNTAVIGGMAAYGILFWGYGGHSFQFANEGWFQRDSIHGGADKLGHAFSTYVGAMAYGSVYDRWGYNRSEASLYGALSGFATFFMIEFGDAFSRHGFSLEDLAMDASGALWGYMRREHPRFRELVDYRVSYFPSYGTLKGRTSDYISDYSGFKYLLAFKCSGIRRWSSSWMRYLELYAGYFTRGYETQDLDHYGDPHRSGFIGVGLNLSLLFKEQGWRKTSVFLDFFQPPYSFVSAKHRFDGP